MPPTFCWDLGEKIIPAEANELGRKEEEERGTSYEHGHVRSGGLLVYNASGRSFPVNSFFCKYAFIRTSAGASGRRIRLSDKRRRLFCCPGPSRAAGVLCAAHVNCQRLARAVKQAHTCCFLCLTSNVTSGLARLAQL